MMILSFTEQQAEPIELFESFRASSAHLGDGEGEAHIYCVRFGPGVMLGEHPAGFGQLFLVVEGSGGSAGKTAKGWNCIPVRAHTSRRTRPMRRGAMLG